MTISKCGTRLVALSMSVVSLLTTASALACGGDWYPEVQVDPRIRGVAQAEKALAAGDYLAAAGSVVRMMPHIETLRPGGDKLVARAERVLAVAIARADGKLAIEHEVPAEVLGHWRGKSNVDRGRNLAWSVATLRRELSAGTITVQKDDPGLQTELGTSAWRVIKRRTSPRTCSKRRFCPIPLPRSCACRCCRVVSRSPKPIAKCFLEPAIIAIPTPTEPGATAAPVTPEDSASRHVE